VNIYDTAADADADRAQQLRLLDVTGVEFRQCQNSWAALNPHRNTYQSANAAANGRKIIAGTPTHAAAPIAASPPRANATSPTPSFIACPWAPRVWCCSRPGTSSDVGAPTGFDFYA
jgi:hypothetical protein